MKRIITKFLTDSITESELKELQTWLEKPKNKKLFETYIKDEYLLNELYLKVDVNKAYDKVLQQTEKKAKQRTIKLSWIHYAAAAIIVALLSVPLVFNQKPATDTVEPVIVNSEIKAGTDKAVLTLDTGEEVALEKGKAFKTKEIYSNGESLTYTEDDQKEASEDLVYNYLTVPRGGIFSIQLSDSTKVWLNSESKIKYPVKFIAGQPRQVELLYGEAYFDVTPSSKHQGDSFVVKQEEQVIEVLGTEFNIKAYKDENSIMTTLVEGAVNVRSASENELLKPKDQALLTKGETTFKIKQVEVYNEISWREGIFSFHNLELKEMAKVLSRWYDVTIEFENIETAAIAFNGVLSKDQNLEKILSIIDVNYEIKNNKVVIQ